ncbi:hypothetical protein [Dietzia sp. PP-33]|uniref:hypothetical protein n=1 Tax=Dietzia sp. PP-33 TaxID=2957500 RepID=UPI0029AA5D9D|nr:hypothetical protein [Dietzia sp. PP-33]MDX2356198.1 hypothetical protein [Dietzia sp. PP-33]
MADRSGSRNGPVPPETAAFAAVVFGGRPFRGAAAVEAGVLTRRELSGGFSRVFPGVYAAGAGELDAGSSVRAAWLWAPAGSVVCGFAAAALHGERYFATEHVRRCVDILSASRPKPPPGITVRVARDLGPGARGHVVDGTPVTSPARTAVDLLRWIDDDEVAISVTDSLCNSTRTPLPEVAATALAIRPAHGVSRVLARLPRCDPRADSPPETRLRLTMGRHGLPAPELQFPVVDDDGRLLATPDLGYRWCRVALFYDGREFHRGEQSDYDAYATARMTELGWEVMRITDRMAASESALMRQIGAAMRRQIERGHASRGAEFQSLGERWRTW